MAKRQDKRPAFKVSGVKDNWETYKFEDGRYLDSLSGMLAIQGPCAAVTFYQNKFFVSYNTTATELTENLLKEILPLIQQKSVDKLLSYYLIFNTEFKKALENQINHIAEPEKYDTTLQNVRGYLKLIENVKNDLEKSCYSNQELDEVYKNKPKDVLNGAELANLQQSFNIKFEKIIKITEQKEQIFQDVLVQYFQLINELKLVNDYALRSIAIRPIQDITKSCYYLDQYGKLDTPFEVIENPRKVHAEVNIAKEFPCMRKGAYIGISKLCCGACDSTLEEYGYLHRGTHGVCFPDDWNSPARQFEDTIERLHAHKQADVVSKDPVLQQMTRQLSTDDFEHDLHGFYSLKYNLLPELFQKEKRIEERIVTQFSKLKISQNCSDANLEINTKEILEADLKRYCQYQLGIDSANLEFDQNTCWISLHKEAIKILREKSNYVGRGTEEYEITSYWDEYSKEGMKELLKLRLESVGEQAIVTTDIIWDNSFDSEKRLINEITSSLKIQDKVLVCLNLYGKHWIGMAIHRSEDKIEVSYMDPEQNKILVLLKEQLTKQLATAYPKYQINLNEVEQEPQKYNNCGPEVIENFISYLTGYRLSQDDTVLVHSALLEDTLLLGLESSDF